MSLIGPRQGLLPAVHLKVAHSHSETLTNNQPVKGRPAVPFPLLSSPLPSSSSPSSSSCSSFLQLSSCSDQSRLRPWEVPKVPYLCSLLTHTHCAAPTLDSSQTTVYVLACVSAYAWAQCFFLTCLYMNRLHQVVFFCFILALTVTELSYESLVGVLLKTWTPHRSSGVCVWGGGHIVSWLRRWIKKMTIVYAPEVCSTFALMNINGLVQVFLHLNQPIHLLFNRQ